VHRISCSKHSAEWEAQNQSALIWFRNTTDTSTDSWEACSLVHLDDWLFASSLTGRVGGRLFSAGRRIRWLRGMAGRRSWAWDRRRPTVEAAGALATDRARRTCDVDLHSSAVRRPTNAALNRAGRAILFVHFYREAEARSELVIEFFHYACTQFPLRSAPRHVPNSRLISKRQTKKSIRSRLPGSVAESAANMTRTYNKYPH